MPYTLSSKHHIPSNKYNKKCKNPKQKTINISQREIKGDLNRISTLRQDVQAYLTLLHFTLLYLADNAFFFF